MNGVHGGSEQPNVAFQGGSPCSILEGGSDNHSNNWIFDTFLYSG